MNIGNTDQIYNNADSFAMFFDKAWKNYHNKRSNLDISTPKKLEIVLSELKDHPFWKSSPKEAKDLAHFRIRLLNLS